MPLTSSRQFHEPASERGRGMLAFPLSCAGFEQRMPYPDAVALRDALCRRSVSVRHGWHVCRQTSHDVKLCGLRSDVSPVVLVHFQQPSRVAIRTTAAMLKKLAAGRVFQHTTASAHLCHGPRTERLFLRWRSGRYGSQVSPRPAGRVRHYRAVAGKSAGIPFLVPHVHAGQQLVGALVARKEHGNRAITRRFSECRLSVSLRFGCQCGRHR